MAEHCEECAFFENPHRPHETFVWLWGVFRFDIDKATKFIKPDDVTEISTESLAPLIDYPKQELDGVTTISILKVPVCVPPLDHIDMGKPILVAKAPKVEGERREWMVIDGHHRIARAVRDKLPSIRAYFLSQEETDSVMSGDRSLIKGAKKQPQRRRARGQTRKAV